MKHGNSQTGKIPIFRERLRELQGDMSITAFAEKLNLTRQTVGFYLNGDRIPDALTLSEIATSCNVSSDWLLGLRRTRSSDESIQSIVENSGLSEKSASALVCAKKLLSDKRNDRDILNFKKTYGIPDFVDADSLFMTCLSIPDFIDTVIAALTANDTLLAQITTAFNLWFTSFPEVNFTEAPCSEETVFIENNRIAIERQDFIKLCTYELAHSVADVLSQHYAENYKRGD